jgi:hypothetical protein
LKTKLTGIIAVLILIISCGNTPSAGKQAAAPGWISSLESAFPSRDWVAVVAQDPSRQHAENAAMNALARAFNTDVESLSRSSQQFSQILDNAAGSKNYNFNESKNFSQEVKTSTSIQGLIGVQTDVYRSPDRTFYVNARMNRRECAARYSGMINENAAIINRLLAGAAAIPQQDSLEAFSRLVFAHKIAQVTDNFQNILEVLDPAAVNNRPAYGGANAIKTKMIERASLITVGIAVNTEQEADRTLFTRALGSYFRDMGFKINENGQGNYILKTNVRLELIRQNVISCRYYIDAALENRNGAVLFSFTEDDRKSHPNTDSEARRLAVRAAETSFKEGKFAQEFDSWLNSLVD